jgi:hypothetical protein
VCSCAARARDPGRLPLDRLRPRAADCTLAARHALLALLLAFLALTVLAGCAPWDTRIPDEYANRPRPRPTIGPAIPLDTGALQVLAQPQIDSDGRVHILAVRSSFSYWELLVRMRTGDRPTTFGSGPMEIVYLVVDDKSVVRREVISRDGLGSRSVRGAGAAFDKLGQLHLLLEYEAAAGEIAHLHLVRTKDGWTDGPAAGCTWLLASPRGLLCAFRSDGQRLGGTDWISPQSGTAQIEYGSNLVLAFESGGAFVPSLLVRDPECPHFLAETMAVDHHGLAYLTYVCGATASGNAVWERRIARFALGGSMAARGTDAGTQLPSAGNIRKIDLAGMPLEIAPVQIAIDPADEVVIVAGQCKSQEVRSGTPAPAAQYCGMAGDGHSAYRLRDSGAVLFARKPQGHVLLAYPESPDGLDAEVHYLELRDGRWSAPVTVAKNGTGAIAAGAVAHASGRAFVITVDAGTSGRWIDPGD